MANETKYVNVGLNAYGQTTAYLCEIEGIKTGDFVIVPALSGEVTGRVMSYAPKKIFSLSLARTKKVIRRANPKEINEVAELFGIVKNPALVDYEDEGSFLTNSGYGTKELNKMMVQVQVPLSVTKWTRPRSRLSRWLLQMLRCWLSKVLL